MGEPDRVPAPAIVAERCEQALTAAIVADTRAAAAVRPRVAGATVLTLSRSATVTAALQGGDPDGIWILESRPGREGVQTAEALAGGDTPVSLAVDAAMSHLLEREGVDLVLVGADAIGPSGTVRNKVGTHTLARAARAADVPVVVVTSTDKITSQPLGDGPSGPRAPVYDRDRPIAVAYPLFDRTPPAAVTAVITETGPLSPAEISEVASRHLAQRRWREQGSG